MKKLMFAFGMAVACTAAAVAAEERGYTPDLFKKGEKILFIGDSVTHGGRKGDMNHYLGHGFQAEIAMRYLGYRPELELQFANRGISGDSSSNVVARWRTDAIPFTPDEKGYDGPFPGQKDKPMIPDWMNIFVGFNDDWDRKRIPPQATYSNLVFMVEDALKANPKMNIVLCEPYVPAHKSPEDAAATRKRRDVVAQVACEYGLMRVSFQGLFDDLLVENANSKWWIWDSCHPTYAGHMRMADYWLKSVAEQMAERRRFEDGDGKDGIFVGQASSMVKVRPRTGVCVPAATAIDLRLARRETEAVQLFVRCAGRDLKNVKVSVSALRPPLSASSVKVSVLGYVDLACDAPYAKAAGQKGWWPDPILDYLDAVDVKAGDLQGFWISVKAPADQAPGTYCGEVTVEADGVVVRRVPISVRVYGFEVPAKTPLPMAITFSPGPHAPIDEKHPTEAEKAADKARRDDPESPVNCWKRHEDEWMDFLADHYVTIDNLYHHGVRKDYPAYNDAYPKVKALRRFADEGRLDCFNLGYWSYPASLSEADKTAWRTNVLAAIRGAYDLAKAAGIEKYAYTYGCDEVSSNKFPVIRWAIDELKAALPGVPVSTTAFDHEFGVGTALSAMDWFTPLTRKYDAAKAEAARREGRQVWWYICCVPHAPYANMFVESPAIEGRVLMGAQTAKFRPDGFLYYQISLWNSERPISGPSAFTDWTARSWTVYNGDGSWVCAGPDGRPMTTVRFENFRDGLEDYAYARALEAKLTAHPDAPWADEARRLLAVPKDVVRSITEYTHDPGAVYAWRNAMAELIEE